MIIFSALWIRTGNSLSLLLSAFLIEMTDLLVNLPASIARSILSNWLGTKALSRLDVVYCNHEQRQAYVDLLSDLELLAFDNTITDQSGFVKLQWLHARNLRCTTFRFNMSGSVSPADYTLLTAHIKRHATRLTSANIAVIPPMLGYLLPVIAAEKCALATLILSSWRSGSNIIEPWDKALGMVLANSHTVVTELSVDCAADWSKYTDGISFPVLRKLSASISSDADLLSMCKAAHNLIELQIIDAHCTDVGLAAIGEHCLALQSLNVLNTDLGVDKIADFNVGIAAIARGCSNLRHLHFENVHITRVGMTAIGTHCTQLESLSLKDCDRCGDTGLTVLAQLRATTLQSLHISECLGIIGDGIEAVATHCKLLHTLEIRDYYSDGEIDNYLAVLPHLTNLTRFKLQYELLNDEMLQLIATHMSSLQHLSIGAYTVEDRAFTSAGLTSIALQCEKLQYFELECGEGLLSDIAQALWEKLRPGLVINVLPTE